MPWGVTRCMQYLYGTAPNIYHIIILKYPCCIALKELIISYIETCGQLATLYNITLYLL